MFLLIMIVIISGGLLLIDRYRYFLSPSAKAFFWFVFVLLAVVLVASLIEGKSLMFAGF
ncbi:hypothetical protein KQN34_001321 [Salmonella enterica subsp. enterica serovar Muenchen]|nr:hypothetical protein [Salmonella enterica subsp. enterica serovar Muenchen]EHQ0640123.1 hypothetical protein [Salmonella enterica subsp. enterica serovar Muenchen]EIJ4894233.1 hypothetical protein [Salmonella enterica subsp. enterica serovar Muenchen]EJF4001051.1 hypothetical protein [Salmonella enterica subsp. enterica serovar Muenchen]ELY1302702.1 hypothetical protein [Salmonella enterica subsp. enterica serovar Muenchen]